MPTWASFFTLCVCFPARRYTCRASNSPPGSCLKTQSPVGKTVWEGSGGVVSLEEICPCVTEGSKGLPIPSMFPLFPACGSSSELSAVPAANAWGLLPPGATSSLRCSEFPVSGASSIPSLGSVPQTQLTAHWVSRQQGLHPSDTDTPRLSPAV